ncbi:MAG: glycosyltransferase family 4 protein [Fimbriimonadaceae bacterium]
MRILICSHTFSPNVGGIETVGRLLAAEFLAAGHAVRICTRTPGDSEDDLGFEVARNPSRAKFRADVAWADVVLHNNISLPWALPLILARKPWVCANHNWPTEEDGSIDWKGRLKLWCSARAPAQISVSRALSAELRGSSVIIGNPYDDKTFHPVPGVVRDRDLLFVGRLLTSKGVDTLIHAAAVLRPQRANLTMTVVGGGPEETNLRALTADLGLTDTVTFTGPKTGAALCVEMSRHIVAVVPSRSRETFGIVALEAMACGCVVIGSHQGGITEAIGFGGPIFAVDDIDRLAALALDFLTSEPAVAAQRKRQAEHLREFTARTVAGRYLEVLERVAKL